MVSTQIRVTCGGCGINYTDAHGTVRHALKTPEDGPFMCEIEQAKRLVKLGVAEYVADTKAPEGDKQPGHLDAAQLEGMNYNELKKLAKDMGVKPEGNTKADYIAAIVAAEVEIGDETEGDDDLPPLNAADPE